MLNALKAHKWQINSIYDDLHFTTIAISCCDTSKETFDINISGARYLGNIIRRVAHRSFAGRVDFGNKTRETRAFQQVTDVRTPNLHVA